MRRIFVITLLLLSLLLVSIGCESYTVEFEAVCERVEISVIGESDNYTLVSFSGGDPKREEMRFKNLDYAFQVGNAYYLKARFTSGWSDYYYTLLEVKEVLD